MMAETKIPDSTPGIITLYAQGDEQALLAKLRYNRLIDIFIGATCYSLQSHLRTTIPNIGQVETDEIYIGVDRRGSHYVFPVQAKGEEISWVLCRLSKILRYVPISFPRLSAVLLPHNLWRLTSLRCSSLRQMAMEQ